jgi:hypothetical protein
MKNLKEYIVEGIFDTDEDTIDKSIKDQIKQFLKDNFDGASSCKISDKPNADGKYEVSSTRNVIVENDKITSLTNGMFIWVKVSGCFSCAFCNSLTSLEGSPEKVSGDFNCGWCKSLTSLDGAPKEVGGSFSCVSCDSLISLEGAPEKVGGWFNCSDCHTAFTTDDVKKVSNVKGMIEV